MKIFSLFPPSNITLPIVLFVCVKRKNEKKKFANCKFPKKAKRLRVPREIFVKRREAEKRGSETPTVDCGGG